MVMNDLRIQKQVLYLMLLALCLMPIGLAAQPAPSNLCVTVNATGFVELTWTIPTNPDPLLNYEIFRDSGTGFLSVDIVGPSTTTNYIDFTANVEQVNSYFVQSTLAGSNSISTDTISNMVLNLNAAVLSVPQLSWNAPTGSPPGTGTYTVYRGVDGAPLTPLATLPSEISSFNDSLFGFCTDTIIDYQVSYNNGICEMRSQIETNEFRDNKAPPQPIIETVTVNINTGFVEVYWYPVNVPDLNFYRIQDIDFVNSNFVNVGTVPALDPTVFIYEDAPTNASTTLGVIAFDQCLNEASFGESATTMFARATYTECDLNAFVEWEPYEGWNEGVEKYVIRADIDGNEDVIMGEVDGGSTFFLSEVEPNREYCFYIEGHSNGDQRVSHSNLACVGTSYPNTIAYNYISSVNVIGDEAIEVNLLQDLNGEGITYELFRSRDDRPFVSLGVFAQTNEPVFTYLDENVDAKNIVYQYKWDAFDGCGALISTSNISQNIVLTSLPDSRELLNVLAWNDYIGWSGDVSEYQIWRKLGQEEDYTLYASFGPDVLFFEDDVEPFLLEEGEFCYKIVAHEGANAFGAAQAQSNESCATQPPIVWIPNTIVIGGAPENRVFKPVLGFIDFDSYEMTIVNKWGAKLFESNNISEGWDGHFKGNPVPEDYYQYIVSFKDGSGKSFIYNDVVYVLFKGPNQ